MSSERITIERVRERVENVNRRLARTTDRRVDVEQRNGYVALDECRGDVPVRVLTIGTKREIAAYLHAMIVALDLSTTERTT